MDQGAGFLLPKNMIVSHITDVIGNLEVSVCETSLTIRNSDCDKGAPTSGSYEFVFESSGDVMWLIAKLQECLPHVELEENNHGGNGLS